MTDSLGIGILGLGNVGSAVYKMLSANQETIFAQTQKKIHCAAIAVKNLKSPRNVPEKILTDDWKQVVQNPEVKIVVELMGDIPEAYEAIKFSLTHQKPVVTANKALLAKHGPELLTLAQKNSVSLLFEASVGGGIPIVKALRDGVVGNQLKTLRAIINGTTNFILSRMANTGENFAEVLKMAQAKGFAESNPESDIEGHDAAAKLSLLCFLAFGVWIPQKNIPTQGITAVTPLDFKMAKDFGFAVRLLATAKREQSYLWASVRPMLVTQKNLLAHVSDSFNAIQYCGDFCGLGMLYGRGAGGEPTASAVISDLIEIVRQRNITQDMHNKGTACRAPTDLDDVEEPSYLRLSLADRPNVLAKVMAPLGVHGISIRSVYQHAETAAGSSGVPVIIFTYPAKNKNLQQALQEITALPDVLEKPFTMGIVEE